MDKGCVWFREPTRLTSPCPAGTNNERLAQVGEPLALSRKQEKSLLAQTPRQAGKKTKRLDSLEILLGKAA